MLSVDSKTYAMPCLDLETMMWYINRLDNDETIVSSTFHYTTWNDDGERLTFKYNGKSVSPTPRTLRLFGAENLKSIISELASARPAPIEEEVPAKLEDSALAAKLLAKDNY